MRIVVDTNVFVSGIFFGGPPGAILEAWQKGQIQLVVSLEILTEYERVAAELAAKYPGVDIEPILSLIALGAEIFDCPALPMQVCPDPDDDKFLACAITSDAGHIVSGDRALLSVSGYGGVKVIRPREFVDTYLNKNW